jgi:hypothetical protein
MPFCEKKEKKSNLYSDNSIVEAVVERIACLFCCICITAFMPFIMLSYLIFGRTFTVGINLEDEEE